MFVKFEKEKIRFFNQLYFPFLCNGTLYRPDTVLNKYLEPHIEEFQKIYKELHKYSEKIEGLYDNPALINGLLIRSLEFRSMGEFKQATAAFEPRMIQTMIFEELIEVEQDQFQQNKSELNDVVTKLIDHPTEWIQRLNEFPIADENRWGILKYLMNPQMLLNDFFALHEELSPLFDEVFKAYEERLILNGNEFYQALCKKEPDVLDLFPELTLKNAAQSFATEEFDVVPLISASLYLRLSPQSKTGYYLVGMYFTEMVQRMKKDREDKKQERMAILKNLSDPTRYEILKRIAHGEKTVKNIASDLEITSATVSYHVNQMVNSGMITLGWRNKSCKEPIEVKKIDELFRSVYQDLGIKEKGLGG